MGGPSGGARRRTATYGLDDLVRCPCPAREVRDPNTVARPSGVRADPRHRSVARSPSSTAITCPVIRPARSDARKTARSATSRRSTPSNDRKSYSSPCRRSGATSSAIPARTSSSRCRTAPTSPTPCWRLRRSCTPSPGCFRNRTEATRPDDPVITDDDQPSSCSVVCRIRRTTCSKKMKNTVRVFSCGSNACGWLWLERQK